MAWWAVANFREGPLRHITPGMQADVFVMSRPNLRFSDVVNSIGFRVTPDADLGGRLAPGLPMFSVDSPGSGIGTAFAREASMAKGDIGLSNFWHQIRTTKIQ